MNQFFSTTASKISLALTIAAFSLVLGTSAQGDEFDRIDNWAKKIQKKSALLTKETVHYRHTPQYAALAHATTSLYDSASHIHEVAHFSNNLNHLQSDLADLNRYFHELEGLFAATEDSASRGHGHVHGSTGRVKGLLRSIEVSIDLIRRDVRKAQSKKVSRHHEVYRVPTPAIRHNHIHDQPVIQHVPVQQYRPRHHQPHQRQSNGFSFSIGGGSSRIHLNF